MSRVTIDINALEEALAEVDDYIAEQTENLKAIEGNMGEIRRLLADIREGLET